MEHVDAFLKGLSFNYTLRELHITTHIKNREKAIQILKSKLIKMMEDSKVQELSQLKVSNEPGSIEWGSQIRSYVLNPYKLVKDHRTNIESSQPEKILEGELDEFIEKEITQLSERSRA